MVFDQKKYFVLVKNHVKSLPNFVFLKKLIFSLFPMQKRLLHKITYGLPKQNILVGKPQSEKFVFYFVRIVFVSNILF